MITEIPLHVLQMFSSLSPSISRPIGVTSHTTPLSIRRGAGGEASVNSVCRRRSVSSKRWLKSSVKSVSSVREKNLYEVCKQPNRGNLTYYSPPYGGGAGGGATRFGGEAAVISIREGTVLLFIILLFCRQTTLFIKRKRLLICRTTGYLLVL